MSTSFDTYKPIPYFYLFELFYYTAMGAFTVKSSAESNSSKLNFPHEIAFFLLEEFLLPPAFFHLAKISPEVWRDFTWWNLLSLLQLMKLAPGPWSTAKVSFLDSGYSEQILKLQLKKISHNTVRPGRKPAGLVLM